MKTNSSFTRTAKQSHHMMMVSIGLAKKSAAKRAKTGKPVDGDAIAFEVLSWRPKASPKHFNLHAATEKEIVSSIGWKLRNPRVRELFSHRKVVYFDAPE